jgi:hypothetical protein
MFARFRQSTSGRLHVSLVEARRANGTVKQEHVASLGSVPMPPSIWDRLSFWQRVHERLPRLSNRIDATAQGKLLAQLHEQIPMVTPEEQRTLQLENAKLTRSSGTASATSPRATPKATSNSRPLRSASSPMMRPRWRTPPR